MKYDFLNNLRFKKQINQIKKALNPDEAFLQSARNVFLSRITGPSRVHIHILRWSTAVFAAIVFMVASGGLAALADYKDVSANNPLYDLKRFSEQTRLALTPDSQKTEVHVQLAERRINELKSVTDSDVVIKPAATGKIGKIASVSISPSPAPTPNELAQKLGDDFQHEAEIIIGRSDENGKIASSSIMITTHGSGNNKNDKKVKICQVLEDALKMHIIDPSQAAVLQARCHGIQLNSK